MSAFLYYSRLTKICWCIMDSLLPFLRNAIFKILFAKKGNGGHIDYGCYFRNMKKIEIGDNVAINRNCSFYASFHIVDAFIKIGNNVAIGPNVTIFGAGHDHTKFDLPDVAENVVVEDNVWVGGNTTILQGVTIGEGAIVGAGSIVTKDVEPWTVVAGVPAKFIKKREVKDRFTKLNS